KVSHPDFGSHLGGPQPSHKMNHLRKHFSSICPPSTLNIFPVPAVEKHPPSMMLPPPCFAVGTVYWGRCAVVVLEGSTELCLVSSEQTTFFHTLLCLLHGL
ncbi:hypothetical protein AMECASPLE_024585, partial [Ameca splendens]